jgi:hypothetical protein
VSVSTEGLAISPGLRDSIYDLVAVQAQHLRHNSRARNFYEDDMIETNTIKRVEEGETALNFMGLDHGSQDVVDGQGLTLTGKVISNREDGTEVVGWVTPFSSKPAIIEVEPSDDSSDVESTPDRIKLVVSSGNLGACMMPSEKCRIIRWARRTVWYDGSFNYRTKEPGTCVKLQSLETTTDCVDKTKSCGLIGKLRIDFIVDHIVCDILDDLVRLRTDGRLCSVSGHSSGGLERWTRKERRLGGTQVVRPEAPTS